MNQDNQDNCKEQQQQQEPEPEPGKLGKSKQQQKQANLNNVPEEKIQDNLNNPENRDCREAQVEEIMLEPDNPKTNPEPDSPQTNKDLVNRQNQAESALYAANDGGSAIKYEPQIVSPPPPEPRPRIKMSVGLNLNLIRPRTKQPSLAQLNILGATNTTAQAPLKKVTSCIMPSSFAPRGTDLTQKSGINMTPSMLHDLPSNSICSIHLERTALEPIESSDVYLYVRHSKERVPRGSAAEPPKPKENSRSLTYELMHIKPFVPFRVKARTKPFIPQLKPTEDSGNKQQKQDTPVVMVTPETKPEKRYFIGNLMTPNCPVMFGTVPIQKPAAYCYTPNYSKTPFNKQPPSLIGSAHSKQTPSLIADLPSSEVQSLKLQKSQLVPIEDSYHYQWKDNKNFTMMVNNNNNNNNNNNAFKSDDGIGYKAANSISYSKPSPSTLVDLPSTSAVSMHLERNKLIPIENSELFLYQKRNEEKQEKMTFSLKTLTINTTYFQKPKLSKGQNPDFKLIELDSFVPSFKIDDIESKLPPSTPKEEGLKVVMPETEMAPPTQLGPKETSLQRKFPIESKTKLFDLEPPSPTTTTAAEAPQELGSNIDSWPAPTPIAEDTARRMQSKFDSGPPQDLGLKFYSWPPPPPPPTTTEAKSSGPSSYLSKNQSKQPETTSVTVRSDSIKTVPLFLAENDTKQQQQKSMQNFKSPKSGKVLSGTIRSDSRNMTLPPAIIKLQQQQKVISPPDGTTSLPQQQGPSSDNRKDSFKNLVAPDSDELDYNNKGLLIGAATPAPSIVNSFIPTKTTTVDFDSFDYVDTLVSAISKPLATTALLSKTLASPPVSKPAGAPTGNSPVSKNKVQLSVQRNVSLYKNIATNNNTNNETKLITATGGATVLIHSAETKTKSKATRTSHSSGSSGGGGGSSAYKPPAPSSANNSNKPTTNKHTSRHTETRKQQQQRPHSSQKPDSDKPKVPRSRAQNISSGKNSTTPTNKPHTHRRTTTTTPNQPIVLSSSFASSLVNNIVTTPAKDPAMLVRGRKQHHTNSSNRGKTNSINSKGSQKPTTPPSTTPTTSHQKGNKKSKKSYDPNTISAKTAPTANVDVDYKDHRMEDMMLGPKTPNATANHTTTTTTNTSRNNNKNTDSGATKSKGKSSSVRTTIVKPQRWTSYIYRRPPKSD